MKGEPMTKAAKDTGVWVAKTGITYPPGEKRKESGEMVDDLLPSSVEPFLLMDAITPHNEVALTLAKRFAGKK